MWNELGFTQNPYDHLPIAANEAGERLLVGREDEIVRLKRKITSRAAIPTLEGDIGVGKTSIISITAYRLEKNFYQNGGPCFLAMEQAFQLDSKEPLEKFSDSVYQKILLKIHKERSDLIARGINVPDTSKLYNWLMATQYNSVGASLGPIGGGSLSTAPNTTQGFSSVGFQNGVQHILEAMFPNPKIGGIICIIDNLELLEKSATARQTLEQMRDKLLSARGMIWIICGARGIVRGVTASARMLSYISKPIQVEPLSPDRIDGLVERRVVEYRIQPGFEKTPVDQQGFKHIFKICRENLRTSLRFCSDFSEWLVDSNNTNASPEDKFELLEAWLAEEADEFRASTRPTPKPWEVFEKIIDEGGIVAPSDHAKFGYDRPEAMRPQVKTLEEAGLVESSMDETDLRRRTISVTPKGWLVNYSRRGYPAS